MDTQNGFKNSLAINSLIFAFMIKNIIFDLGGVLLNLDFKRAFDAFAKLGFSDFDELFGQHNADDLFQKLETGKITPAEFYKELKLIAPREITAEQLENAWNAMLVSYRKESLDFLLKLKEHYSLYLLSNTNEIHHSRFLKMLQEETEYQNLHKFFIKTWYSHEIHHRKPDVEIFEFVLHDAGIEAGETLFIDDSPSNLPNAGAIGMKTQLLLPEERVENLDFASY